MKLRLVVQTDGANRGKVLEITLAQFVIGRDPQCHLRPASALISKRHCALIKRDGKAFLSDFGSTNGTFVNDQPVKGEIELKDGDHLKIGPLHFQVKLEADAASGKPTSLPSAKTPGPVAAKAPGLAVKPAKPPQAERSAADDDEIAALLMGDDPAGGPIPEKVPDGSTVMDLAAMQAAGEKSPESTQQGGDAKKPADNKAKAVGPGDTRSAADAILKKYMKRPRG